jgi:hypothetical protein
MKHEKEMSFMMVRNLLADALILNLKLQKEYDFLNVPFEGSNLEKEYVKLDSRYKNNTHLKIITK